MLNDFEKKFVMRIHLLAFSILACVTLYAQSHIEIGKVLNYKQPVSPTGADNYQYSTYYYNGKKAYNMKGFDLGTANNTIVSLKVNPAGSQYALLSRKSNKSMVEVFDAWTRGKVLYTLKDATTPTAICYSADSKRFFVANEYNQLRVYDTRQYTFQSQWNLDITPSLLAASPNGYFISAANGEHVVIINQETGRIRTTLTVRGNVNDMAFSDASDMIGVITTEGQVSVFETRNFQLINEYSIPARGNSLAFHPDGKYVAALSSDKYITFLNLADVSDKPMLQDEDGGLTYLRFLKDGKHQIYLSYNTNSSVKYKLLKGLSPNLTKFMTEELNARMDEWAKMKPDETLEEYRARVNEETRLEQARLFEQEIATELANDLVMRSEVSLGNYNLETNMLTLNFDNMPQIYLTVPEAEVSSFQNASDLEFRDVIYGMTKNEKFEIIYTKVYNKATGKTYEFNNLERQSLDFLQSQDDFVPIELVQQSSMEDVKLQAIKEDVVTSAKQNNLISDHTLIKVSSSVVSDVDANGRRITNYKINFNYTVEGSYSIQEDFAAGKYKIEQSHAAVSMLEIVTRAFAQDFAQYIKPSKKVIIKITGSADALKINGSIVYDGCYGNFVNEPYYLDGALNTMTVTTQTGIRKNEQLAFMRAIGVKDYLMRHISSLQAMQTDYQHNIELAEGTGGEFRRINVEFIFVDAFDNQ